MPKAPKISLQYVCNISKFQFFRAVDVFHAAKHESFLEVDSIIFDGFDQASSNYPSKFAIYICDILRKKSRMKLRTS